MNSDRPAPPSSPGHQLWVPATITIRTWIGIALIRWQPQLERNFKAWIIASVLWLSAFAQSCCFGQTPGEKDYLGAVLPPDLMRYAGVEVPSEENIHIRSDSHGRYLEFRLIPGQARKNNGIRAEISVNFPYKAGDIVRYKWQMRLPDDFKADEPQNRWWVMGQWHDQPDRTKGETWQGFPGRSPPVSFNYGRRDGKDFLSLLVGSPRMKSVGLLPITRGAWHSIDVVIQWSQASEGKVAVFFDGSKAPAVSGSGPNMHNGFHHYLKLGMYRHPEIATENRLDIREVFIEKLQDWPVVETH